MGTSSFHISIHRYTVHFTRRQRETTLTYRRILPASILSTPRRALIPVLPLAVATVPPHQPPSNLSIPYFLTSSGAARLLAYSRPNRLETNTIHLPLLRQTPRVSCELDDTFVTRARATITKSLAFDP